MEEVFCSIQREARAAITALLSAAHLKKGEILVVGCSTSEVLGKHIGKGSSEDVAKAILSAFLPVAREAGIFLAFQWL